MQLSFFCTIRNFHCSQNAYKVCLKCYPYHSGTAMLRCGSAQTCFSTADFEIKCSVRSKLINKFI